MTGLVLWVCGAILAGSACQNAVASALSPWRSWNNLRQYLREWLYDGSDRTSPCQTQLDAPVIHMRKPTRGGLNDGIYGEDGSPTCVGMATMEYVRTDPETGHHLLKCPPGGCGLKAKDNG